VFLLKGVPMVIRRGRVFLVALALGFVLLAFLGAAEASVLPYWLKVEKVLDNSVELGAIAETPNQELWLLERTTGLIRVYVNGNQSATLTLPVYANGASGLLGVAFAPDYAFSGRAFVFSVDASRKVRVDAVDRVPGGLSLGALILDLGTAPSSGLRPGGGVAVGPDGKLYVSVGDLELPGSAQDDLSLTGKVLRTNLDGTVPADNPSGTLVWAKGFRDGAGLDINPATTRANGTMYVADCGSAAAPTASDELHQVPGGGNGAWNSCSGPGCGAPYVEPLASFAPASLVDPESVASNYRNGLGAAHEGALLYSAKASDKVREAVLTGSELDQLTSDAVLFDPNNVTDGNPAPVCPKLNGELALGREGWLYMSNTGANPGIWRIWRDLPGPREVSADGSPFRLTVDKDGTNLRVGWENLGTLDTGRPTRNAAQQVEKYSVWEGSLPITAYDHVRALNTDGTADGPARLVTSLIPGAGSRYYLVGAQADNKDGSLGMRTGGTGRTGPFDYCDTKGWGTLPGKCVKDFTNPVNGSVLKLMDYNPKSPTYNQYVSISDFRGRVVRLDLSADT